MAYTVLVTGATGKQGSAVIDALLASSSVKDILIFALTRNPESAPAKALQAKAPEKIELAVFGVSIPVVGIKPNDEEKVTGKALVDAALAHGVEHFVYTSVDRHGADSDSTDTDIPHFVHKAHVEKHLIEVCKNSKMTWTILRPTVFMDNIVLGFAGKMYPTAWKVGLSPDKKLQLIATKDIGYFGAQALLSPKWFAGRAISLAGDELTFAEANTIFAREIGCDIPTTFGALASALIWAVKDVHLMFKFFENVGYAADVQTLRVEHPGLLSFGDWVKTCDFAAK